MLKRKFVFALIALAIVLAPLAQAKDTEPDLWPSEVVTLMNQAMKFDPTAERKSVSGPVIARMRTADLSEMERFFKAEAHFINLEPEPSRDGYWEFRQRTDALGRVASQRLMIIRINAFGMADEITESDIPSYRERFPVVPYDRYGITYPLSQTARFLIDQGEANRALDLIVEEVRQYGQFDSPYSAYSLPGQFLAVALEHGRGEEFLALHQWVVDGLDAAVGKRMSGKPPEPEQVEPIPSVVFRSLFEDRAFDHYRWTAEMIKQRDRLKAAAE